MQDVVNGNLAAREREIPQVEAIAEEEAGAFMQWLHTLAVLPTITDLRQRAESVKASELDKAFRRLGDVSEQDRQVIAARAHALVNKLLHEPTVRLKQHAARSDSYLYTEVVRELLGLGVGLARDE